MVWCILIKVFKNFICMSQRVKQVLSYVVGLAILVLGVLGVRYLPSQKQAPLHQVKELVTSQVQVQLVKNFPACQF